MTSRSARARQLRRDSTDAERALWSILRNRQLGGYKFRRQAPIGAYFVDFVCMDRKLIIEVDGGHHEAQALEDLVRTGVLQSKGFHVLRVWNHDVLMALESVADAIVLALEEGPSP